MTQEQREEYLRFMSDRHKVDERMQHFQMMQQYTSLRKKMRDDEENDSDGEDSFDAQALHDIQKQMRMEFENNSSADKQSSTNSAAMRNYMNQLGIGEDQMSGD